MLTPDLTPIYGFIAIIVILMSVAMIFSEGRAQRLVLLVVIFGSLGVGFHLHNTSMTDRLQVANKQTADAVRCLSETGQFCQWETH